LVACVVSRADYSYAALLVTNECAVSWRKRTKRRADTSRA
jgi:hypothetical protein